MKKIFLKILILFVSIILISGFLFLKRERPIKEGREKISVYFSPNCGCCFEYIAYLKEEGFSVEKFSTYNMLSIKERFKVPNELQSCHTSVIENYFVEGHVPIEAIKKLISERPNIAGISLAKMPSGSPGMPGPKMEKFQIHQITSDGKDGGIFLEL